MNHHLEIKIDYELLRPTDEKVIVGDITKIKKDTGWEQKISMTDTVRDMINYWRMTL